MTPDDRSEPEKSDRKSAMSNFASGLLATEEEDKKAKKQIIKEGVKRLEKKESDLINSSKLLTSELAKLREQADMSPFVGTSGKIKSPRIKRADFIEILAREILWIGREEMKDRGGVISLSALRKYFERERDNWELREKDIPEALSWLDKEDLIPNLDKLDDITLIHFRPVELSTDTRHILRAAHGIDVTRSRLLDLLGWKPTRLDTSLNQLEQDGIVIIDGDNIYFPGL